MDEEGARARTIRIVMGLVFLAVGALPFLAMLGVLPTGPAPRDPAPNWMAWLIGLMFSGAGLYIIQTAFTGDDPSGDTAAGRFALGFRELLALFIMAGLACLFSWIAFGPGPRHFSASIGFAGLILPVSGDAMGRTAFGLGAVLAWCGVALFLWAILRRP